MGRLYVLAGVIAVLVGRVALADAPPEPDMPRHACSLNSHWCVERVDPPALGGVGTVRIFKHDPRSRGASEWSAPARIVGALAITNDGLCVIDLATGSNVIPLDKKPDDAAFAFYCKGSAVRVLPLRRFIVNFDALPLSTAHRVWAESFGLDEHDHLVVNTAEGRAFLIDPHDGTLLKGAYVN